MISNSRRGIIVTVLLFAWIVSAGFARAEGRTWVFFSDKGYDNSRSLQKALKQEEARLLPATRARLLKIRAPVLLSEADLPVFADYLDGIEKLTCLRPHALSRTLNAASYALSAEQIRAVERLPFVACTKPVRRFQSEPDPLGGEALQKLPWRSVEDSLFYGASWTQNVLENFPDAHDAGYTGEGVLVGMLDAGWNNLGHVCFDHLDIVATWDFVNGDSSVADDPGQMGSGTHGTKTLSCLAGYDPGNLIGTAYGISVALAKTENTESEHKIEEDNWIAGLEWLDSLGCAIVTSSVSYLEFQWPDTSYTWEDLDGNTALCTIAADNAVARGIVVLNSDGNNGGVAYPDNKMNVPADGDSVLMIGSVDAEGVRTSFSSYGPTYDGRIKPDLVALGASVRVASAYSTTGYTSSSGSSFSTPITAGACALLLQAGPSLTPMEVHAFLKETGDQAVHPDTLRGWGLYDVWQAVQNVLSPVRDHGTAETTSDFRLFGAYPNPFNSAVTIHFERPRPGNVTIQVYSPEGRLILGESRLYPAGYQRWRLNFESLSSGLYLCRVSAKDGGASTLLLHLK